MKKRKRLKLKLKDHQITLNEAANLTENYRDAQTENVYVKAQLFGQEAIRALLDQSGCIGVRMYYGLSGEGVPRLVLAGVDEAGNDMCEGIILDKGVLCPTECSESNDLNC
ncbi:MAG: hypothetical protein V4651_00410 [Bacteroidota bacterium]